MTTTTPKTRSAPRPAAKARPPAKAAKSAKAAPAAKAAKSAKPAKPAPTKAAKSAARTPAASASRAPKRGANAPKPAAPRKSAERKESRPKAKAPLDPVARMHDEVHKALESLKAKDVSDIDVRGKSSFADYLIVASGTSTRHVKSIADEVVRFAKRAGFMPLGVEGQREAEWVLVDLGDIVVHVMLPRVREFYGLERLWLIGDERREAAAG